MLRATKAYGFDLLGNRPGEQNVSVRCTDPAGNVRHVPGYFVDQGCPVLGIELDPDAEQEYEYGRSEIKLTLCGDVGPIKEIVAWLSTDKGNHVVFRQNFPEPRRGADGTSFTTEGPAFDYNEREGPPWRITTGV